MYQFIYVLITCNYKYIYIYSYIYISNTLHPIWNYTHKGFPHAYPPSPCMGWDGVGVNPLWAHFHIGHVILDTNLCLYIYIQSNMKNYIYIHTYVCLVFVTDICSLLDWRQRKIDAEGTTIVHRSCFLSTVFLARFVTKTAPCLSADWCPQPSGA